MTITFDIRKVSYAKFFWKTNEGCIKNKKPRFPTVRGVKVEDEEALALCDMSDLSQETMLERARRLEILDVWIPVVIFQMTNSHSLEFIGKRALSLHKAWLAYVFGKEKQKKKGTV